MILAQIGLLVALALGGQTPAQAPTLTEQIEAHILKLTNLEREKGRIPPLSPNRALSQAAREHSSEMLKRGFFSHDSPVPGKRSASDRVGAVGYRYASCAENIAMMEGLPVTDPEAVARRFVTMWMKSPGHRDNLMGQYTDLGVGVAIQDRKAYATQVFGTPQG